MPNPPSTPDPLDITMQLAAAFGQGTGSLPIEVDALRPAYDAYRENIARAAAHWEADALSSISVMRSMGAYAAHLALSDRRFVISRADVENALGIVTRAHPHPLGPCRLSHR
jgi:hypothetical protein